MKSILNIPRNGILNENPVTVRVLRASKLDTLKPYAQTPFIVSIARTDKRIMINIRECHSRNDFQL